MQIVKYNRVFDHIETTIREYFEKNSNFDDVVFVLGYNCWKNLQFVQEKFPGYRIIIIQLEQLFEKSKWWNNNSYNMLKNASEIWDYDKNNILFLNKNGIKAKHFPLPYTKTLKKLQFIENKDIDILFYGYMNDRRFKILKEIQDNYGSLKIISLFNVWGEELDRYLERTKIILNIHYFNSSSIQEQARLYYLIINNKCVVSESSSINHYNRSLIECNYDDIVKTTINTLHKQNWSTENKSIGDIFMENSKIFYKN